MEKLPAQSAVTLPAGRHLQMPDSGKRFPRVIDAFQKVPRDGMVDCVRGRTAIVTNQHAETVPQRKVSCQALYGKEPRRTGRQSWRVDLPYTTPRIRPCSVRWLLLTQTEGLYSAGHWGLRCATLPRTGSRGAERTPRLQQIQTTTRLPGADSIL